MNEYQEVQAELEYPTEDGYVDITFINGQGRRFLFREMLRDKGWHDHDNEIVIPHEGGRTIIPKSSVLLYDVKLNSDKFMKELRKYQDQHNHNWVPVQEPADPFGMTTRDSETNFFCGTSKTGRLGCGVRKMDGVIVHNG